jgi:enolase-phosphatase E1
VTVSLSAFQTRALVLDIEGTTTPVEFVYQVLFPYARTHASAYLEREGQSAACRAAIAQLRDESRVAEDVSPAATGVAADVGPPRILEYFYSLMDRDRKSPGLKALQGLIWQDGYESGELRGQVYPDVAPAFERWRARGLDLYIYSSGSVLAQQLLFGSTNAGDLTKFLKGYFDTEVGSKTSPDSYRAISERVRVAPSETLFVSDVARELDAARTSGIRTVLCIRAGDPPSASDSHPSVRSFDEIVE